MKYEDEIYKTIEIIVRKIISEQKFDLTLTGKVIAIDGDNYLTSINDDEKWLKSKDGLILEVGDIVYVRCVRGNLSEKYIDCKKP